MRKSLIAILSLACLGATVAAAGCTQKFQAPSAPLNGGFESGDLSGWTVEYGNAFDDDCVMSDKTFTFENDVNANKIAVEATGNWYLSGKGYRGKNAGIRTGAIRSTEFIIPQDGVISMKLAGGALTIGKGDNAAMKADGKQCFVGIYRASDDRLIAKQKNEYFNEHTEDYVNPDKYASGACHTDNFNSYTLDLSKYAGERAYIRIVDEDDSYYYGYLAVDDIRIGGDAEAQTEGVFFTKTYAYETSAQAPSQYEIANGGFETGSLAGWTIVSGDAFSHDGVNSETVYWNENIPYNRDGDYHYGFYRPEATGIMRSSEFKLGGTGYISWKLGGCKDNGKTYLRFMLKTDGGAEEIARFSNFMYNGAQFPYVVNGMRHANMVQYYTQLPKKYLGKTLFIEVVDNNNSGAVEGSIVLDSVKTYWEQPPAWKYGEAYFAEYDEDIRAASDYQIVNGGFENGLEGWTQEGVIGEVTDADTWWNEGLLYNKKGRRLFSGINHEGGTGTLTSPAFTVGGSGYITFLLGGGKNPELCYISVIDEGNGEELARYSNSFFCDKGTGTINYGSNLANMVWYKADLSAFSGREVKLRITDRASGDWGLITADSFVTYYKTESEVPAGAIYAVNHADTDKSKLNALVGAAINERGDFTDDTFNAYTNLLNEARAVSGDRFVSQPTVNALYKNLRRAQNNLAPRVPIRNDQMLPRVKIAKGFSRELDAAYYVDTLALSSITYEAVSSNEVALTAECAENGRLTLTAGNVEEDAEVKVTVKVLYKGKAVFEYDIDVSVISSTAPQPVENLELFVDKFARSNKEQLTVNFADYLDNPAGYELKFTATIDGEPVEMNGAELRYDITADYTDEYVTKEIKVSVAFKEDGADKTVDFTFTLHICDTTAYRVENGGFETGNLDGWQILTQGMTGGVISEEIYWGERLPYNQAGKYHLDGWNTGIPEAGSWSIRSTEFTLGGCGFISLRMGGNAAAVKVFKADGTQIGEYCQTRFSDTNFPFTGDGAGKGSWADMGTYFIDLHDYVGEKLYIELHDTGSGAWAHAFFDEVVTYYREVPDVENGYDTVTAPIAPGFVYGEVNLKWTLAENRYGK